MKPFTRRTFLQGAAGMAAAAAAGQAAPAPRRPNLLFVFSDQHSYDMLGCYGNEQIVTPHLDAFARQGVRFNHCVSSAPICTPYRSMLLSGQHPIQNGAFTNDVQMRPGTGNYFAEVLRDGGYRTGYVGKWHLYGGDRNRPIPEGPLRYGFDGTFLSNNCHVDYRAGHCYYWNEAGEKIFFDEWEVYGQTQQAMQFLDTCKEDEPFALFVSWHPPHDWGKFPDGNWRYDTLPELMALYDPDEIKLRPTVEDTPGIRRSYHGHMAQVSGVDRAFGMLMAKLAERGLDENTLVVFTADHGDVLGSRGRPGPKTVPEDEASRVPLLMRWPGRLTPRVSDLLVGTLDLMPTLLGMTGLPVPGACQGRNLSEAIREHDDDAVDSVPMFIIPGRGWRGVYTRRYCYAFEKPGAKPYYSTLYDRDKDPRSETNLFGNPEYAEVQAELHAKTLEWMKRFGDTFEPYSRWTELAFGGEGKDARQGITEGRPIDLFRKHADAQGA